MSETLLKLGMLAASASSSRQASPSFPQAKSRLSTLVLILCSATLHGADGREAAWSNLEQLRSGQKIQVVHKNFKSQEGEFLRFSEETISFRVKNDDVSVPRDEVLRITLREGHRRLRGTLLGMLVGGGIGLAVGAAQDSKYNCSDPSSDYCYHKMAGGVIGLGIGAAAGAAVPPRYPTIYRATPPKRD